jgi:hypothetical protein
MANVHQPVAGAHHHVPRPGTYGIAVPAGLPGRARSLHTPRIHAQTALAATIPVGRTCFFFKLDILEWRGLGAAVAHELFQHHVAPTTSYLGPGLGT